MLNKFALKEYKKTVKNSGLLVQCINDDVFVSDSFSLFKTSKGDPLFNDRGLFPIFNNEVDKVYRYQNGKVEHFSNHSFKDSSSEIIYKSKEEVYRTNILYRYKDEYIHILKFESGLLITVNQKYIDMLEDYPIYGSTPSSPLVSGLCGLECVVLPILLGTEIMDDIKNIFKPF